VGRDRYSGPTRGAVRRPRQGDMNAVASEARKGDGAGVDVAVMGMHTWVGKRGETAQALDWGSASESRHLHGSSVCVARLVSPAALLRLKHTVEYCTVLYSSVCVLYVHHWGGG
jgi:hypothetical protein